MSREFRFLHCVLDALCDSLGATPATARKACVARRPASPSPGRAAGGYYDLPTFQRRGIRIAGLTGDQAADLSQ